MKQVRIYVVTNNKGGVGKTTTSAQLGLDLKKRDNKVLMIDADSQSNLSLYFGVDETIINKSLFDLLTD